jgi:hypothetical protein
MESKDKMAAEAVDGHQLTVDVVVVADRQPAAHVLTLKDLIGMY